MLTAVDYLETAIIRHDNNDDVAKQFAMAAIAYGRPAYWANVKYHDALTWSVVNDANTVGLATALSRVPAHRQVKFDRIIPLNVDAVYALEGAKALAK